MNAKEKREWKVRRWWRDESNQLLVIAIAVLSVFVFFLIVDQTVHPQGYYHPAPEK
jgi:hypothetical protein